MLFIEHPSFKTLNPEDNNWSQQTSIKVEAAARIICEQIRDDFRTPERALVPGLRAALLALAKTVEHYEG